MGVTLVERTQIHNTAEVSEQAQIGEATRIWHHAQIREKARVGSNCIIGKGVYVDHDVVIGDNVKIENGAFLYHGVTVEDGAFIGPGACLTNDKYPRAILPSGELKRVNDWQVEPTTIRRGASVGARAVVLPGIVVGRFAMVAAGAVVTRDVPDHGLVQGNPARLVGFVCACGRRLTEQSGEGEEVRLVCLPCQLSLSLPPEALDEAEDDPHL
jgi:UDP-2-acetamido-3-amino-2,3-dideoxy-glucuronate N-acetyltransferase